MYLAAHWLDHMKKQLDRYANRRLALMTGSQASNKGEYGIAVARESLLLGVAGHSVAGPHVIPSGTRKDGT